ncbi:hypothetical protein [uncultured Erythrobacter sp.]|uniref:hypothetical protein n=1 Tax=uncultured Erythrobacter sp. TaxID=263913 RepID=UPI00261FC1ED|nr:hypothetical protein [uncultured Erythrobacter sp.]
MATIPTCIECNNSFSTVEEYMGQFVRSLAKRTRQTDFDAPPDFDAIRTFVIKNAKAHLFYENGEPRFEDPSTVGFAPLYEMTNESLASFLEGSGPFQPWCEVGSRWNTRVATGDEFDSHGFLVVQEGTYRFRIEAGGLGVSSILRDRFVSEVYW